MDEKILSYLEKYNEDVEYICQKIAKFLTVDDKQQLLRKRIECGSGKFINIDNLNKFAFHGRGCIFIGENKVVDWDFGYDDFWCGIDPWKLSKYIIDNFNQDIEKYSGHKLQSIFDSMVNIGQMYLKYDLYYLNEEWLSD